VQLLLLLLLLCCQASKEATAWPSRRCSG
jgi:hypothetical protein